LEAVQKGLTSISLYLGKFVMFTIKVFEKFSDEEKDRFLAKWGPTALKFF